MSRPTVTIGIPTFNRLDELRVCVASATAQDHPSVEVIVCDNASDDGTSDFLAEEQSRGVLRHIRHERNQGAHLNFLSALEAASGEYFMWLADDDWLDPDYVTACLDVLRSHSDAVLAAGSSDYRGPGAHDWSEPVVEILDPTPAARIRRYYSQVRLNGEFFGLARTELRRSIALPAQLGGDWVHMAGLISRGSLRAAPTTIHRSAGGASAEMTTSLLKFGIPISALLTRDLVRRHEEIRSGPLAAWVLSAQCSAAVCWHHVVRRRLSHAVSLGVRFLRAVLPSRIYRRIRSAYRMAVPRR